MSNSHWKKVALPAATEPLLDAWRKFADTAGIITTAGSVAEARQILTTAADNGVSITATTPAYFDIHGVLYRADGRKNGTVWVLSPLNEVEVDSRKYSTGWSGHLNENQFHAACSTQLPARPYDRLVAVTAGAYGRCTKGRMNFAIVGHNGAFAAARWDPDEESSVSVSLQTVVPAGEAPNIKCGPQGGWRGGDATLTTNDRFNFMVATAYPITMA